MKQIAKRITFHELLQQPDGTEFTACFADDVKRGLSPVILKKRSPRDYAEHALAGVQVLGTDRDGKEHAIPNGTADFSVTLGSTEPELAVPVNPEWTEAELAAIRQLATDKNMPPSQVIRQALRMYQAGNSQPAGWRGEWGSDERRVVNSIDTGLWTVQLVHYQGYWLRGCTRAGSRFSALIGANGVPDLATIPEDVDTSTLLAFISDNLLYKARFDEAAAAIRSRPDAPVQSDSPRGE